MFYRRSFFSVLVLIVTLSLIITCNLHKDEKFRFVFMTDIHLQPELGAVEGFKAAIVKVNSLQPEANFVITGGDLVFDAMKQGFARADSLYLLYTETSGYFTMSVYNTIGNHEIFGHHIKASVDSSHAEYGKKMFTSRLGAGRTYRSFDYKNWHFILLDAMTLTFDGGYIGKVDPGQLQWLKTDLEKVGTDRPVVIVTHIPFYTIFSQYYGHPTRPNDD